MTLLTGIDDRAWLYSPLGFLRERREELADHVRSSLTQGLQTGVVAVVGSRARWFLRQLPWDSEYFGVPIFRLDFADWDSGLQDPARELAASLTELRRSLAEAHGQYYLFAEVPSEDLPVVQAFGLSGFRLIETRGMYYRDDPLLRDGAPRWPVRLATTDDIPHLRDVAASARNPLDRYHADPYFPAEIADAYIATYVEESLKGLAQVVLIPDPRDGEPAGGFFTATLTGPDDCPLGIDHHCSLGLRVGRIVLVAVGADRRGWHSRLMNEMTRLFWERGVDVACMTTQIANRAVVRNSETLGYHLGRTTHVFATSPVDTAPR